MKKTLGINSITISNGIPGKDSTEIGSALYSFLNLIQSKIDTTDLSIQASIITKTRMKNRGSSYFQIALDPRKSEYPIFLFKMSIKGNVGYIGTISFTIKKGSLNPQSILDAYNLCKEADWQQ